ncbi:MAG: hypothetical protein IJY06_01375 [Oscillospiraceae bacterium]|nr:hypothetical protein [Oscillospiraceae bacterium]
MELCTEFLIHIDKRGGIATTDDSFKNLLMSNSDIKIINKHIDYQGKKYSFAMQSGDIQDMEVRFYHIFIKLELKIEEEQNCFEDEKFKSYQKLLTAVKQIFYGKGTRDDGRMLLENNAVSFEILWDDVSLLCSQKAYPLIYKIENLMRKLITKFMLVNIGTEWETRNIPDAMKNGKIKMKTNARETGYLYQRDFIELSDYLFKAYPMKRCSINDLMETKDAPESIPYEKLKDYFLISNWDRYFKSILDVDSEKLKKQWKELYDLRCDIAHNNLFSLSNYNQVVKLTDELTPKIQAAIEKLDEIQIDSEDRERVFEANASPEELVGIFLRMYNNLFNILLDLAAGYSFLVSIPRIGRFHSILHILEILRANGYETSDEAFKELKGVTYLRNKLTHSSQYWDYNPSFISGHIYIIKKWIDFFESEARKYHELCILNETDYSNTDDAIPQD